MANLKVIVRFATYAATLVLLGGCVAQPIDEDGDGDKVVVSEDAMMASEFDMARCGCWSSFDGVWCRDTAARDCLLNSGGGGLDLGGGGGSIGGRCASGSGCSNSEIRSLQNQCRQHCALGGSTSRGIHECHLTFQNQRSRMVSGTCDCAEGWDYHAQMTTWC